MIKTKTITIQTEQGEKRIKASIVGRFAVHPQASWDTESNEFYFDKEWFSVTHIETGLSIMRIIETKKAAIEFARMVNNEFHEAAIESAIRGEDSALSHFSRIIKNWYALYGAIYSF